MLFLDDNIGSGRQAHEIFSQWFGQQGLVLDEHHVTELNDEMKDSLRCRSIAILSCVAYTEGVERLQAALPNLGLELRVCKGFTSLDEQVGCFHPTTDIFYSDDEDREEAKEMVERIGVQLLAAKNWSDECKRLNALGYGGNQGLTVFFHNTPTSTLPVLWARGTVDGAPWFPLFLRREKA